MSSSQAPLCLLLSWQGLAASIAQHAGSLQQGKSLMNKCWVKIWSPCLSLPPSIPQPGSSLAEFFFFPACHKHKMELAGSKNNLSKMAGMQQGASTKRRKGTPAVQYRDPIFFITIFAYVKSINPTESKLILSWILISNLNSKFWESRNWG